MSISRDEIRKIWIFSLPNPHKKKQYAGIGVGVGLISALGLTLSQMERQCGDCTGVKVGIVAAIVGLPVGGALIGRKLGSRGERLLIYQIT
jgi:hypothetical protein